jgi:hypothetical protein
MTKPSPSTSRILKQVKQSKQPSKTSLQPPAQVIPPPPCTTLLTKPQMIERIKDEIVETSLTATAQRYNLKPSQLSDVIYGRANLSKKMLAKLNVRMFEFYQLMGLNGKVK